ncbi:MAG: glucose 1-dehydrogenase [Clostridiales bacterium]|nr:glucose 1-dehydrogenase [Clostridiales bacterium]
MENKVVLITGAAKGIGASMAELFAQKGYKVVINYNKSEMEAVAFANKICAKGQIALPFKADISKNEQAEQLIAFALKNFGHIDVLINNAGISTNKLLVDESYENITQLINNNLVSTINTTRLVAKHMITQGQGKILNISSIWGLYGASNESVYSASKGGIIAFTKAMAKELAYNNITVNCIAPGVVETDMLNCYNQKEKETLKQEIPLNRFANPSEIAELALFLASEKSDYITGQVIQIDGGFYI